MAVPYIPIDSRGHRLTVGIRPLDLSDWLEIDSNRVAELAIKAELESDLGQVYAELPLAKTAVSELFELVLQNLAEHHSQTFRIDADRVFDIERDLEVSDQNRLLMLSRLLQEDFCIMTQTDSGWVLSAAALFSPSRWSLLEKIGQNLQGIHVPVPHYEEKLGRAVEQLFDRMTVEKPVWRANWTVLDDPTNFQPAPPSAANRKPLAGADLLNELFFRVERQCLIKLPTSGAVVFTIRTYVNTLAELLAADSTYAELLLNALRTTDIDHTEYRGWQSIQPALIELLESF